MHLDLVAYGGWRLRILDVVHVLIGHLGLHVAVWSHLVVVNVVLAASGSRAARIRVYTSNPIVGVVRMLTAHFIDT